MLATEKTIRTILSIALITGAERSIAEQGQQAASQQSARRQKVISQNEGARKQPSNRQQSQKETQKNRKRANGRASSDYLAADPQDMAPNTEVRQFHEVLNDLLSEFAYDVKQGQVNGLKNLSVRRVDISDTLPKTYEQYVELLVSERIRENSKVKLINCVPCKTKSSTMV